jgi:hypothetical protein
MKEKLEIAITSAVSDYFDAAELGRQPRCPCCAGSSVRSATMSMPSTRRRFSQPHNLSSSQDAPANISAIAGNQLTGQARGIDPHEWRT